MGELPRPESHSDSGIIYGKDRLLGVSFLETHPMSSKGQKAHKLVGTQVANLLLDDMIFCFLPRSNYNNN